MEDADLAENSVQLQIVQGLRHFSREKVRD